MHQNSLGGSSRIPFWAAMATPSSAWPATQPKPLKTAIAALRWALL